MPGENIQDWSVTAASNASSDSSINWAEGMARAAVNDSARSEMAAVAKWRNLLQGAITTGGTGSAFTFSSGRTHTGAVPTNMMALLKMSAAPSAGATLNMDGIGAVTIKDQNGSSLAGNEWPANSYQSFIYDGTNWKYIHDVPPAITGNSLVLISTQTASSSSSVAFTSGIASTYDEYQIHIAGARPDTNNTAFWMRVSEDSGATWKSGASDYGWEFNVTTGGANTAVNDAFDSEIEMTGTALSSSGPSTFSGIVKMFKPSSSSVNKLFMSDLSALLATSTVGRFTGVGGYGGTTNPINGIQFLMSSGNIAEGGFSLYGLKKA